MLHIPVYVALLQQKILAGQILCIYKETVSDRRRVRETLKRQLQDISSIVFDSYLFVFASKGQKVQAGAAADIWLKFGKQERGRYSGRDDWDGKS